VQKHLPFRFVVISAVLASFVWSILDILGQPDKFQWSLRVYYEGPLLLARNLNPYEVGNLGYPSLSLLAFPYPPIFLPIFTTLSIVFTYKQFYVVFLLLKIACLAILLFIWKRFYVRKIGLDIFLVFVWLGFYATLFLDFVAGNISVFETTVLFLGFLFFLKGRTAPFVLMILLGASVKLTPAVFLCLLPLSSIEHKWKYFSAGCLVFLAFCLSNLFLFPDLSLSFFRYALQHVDEDGYANPSSLALITDVLARGANLLGLGANKIIAAIIYSVFIGTILWMSLRAWVAAAHTREDEQRSRLVLSLFVILVYTLVMPRMKNYAYIIAVPSVLFALESIEIQIPRWLMFLPLIFVVRGPSYFTVDMRMPHLFHGPFETLLVYYPLFVAFFFWHVYMQELKRQVRRDNTMLNTQLGPRYHGACDVKAGAESRGQAW
jgi:hypothetical protein